MSKFCRLLKNIFDRNEKIEIENYYAIWRHS